MSVGLGNPSLWQKLALGLIGSVLTHCTSLTAGLAVPSSTKRLTWQFPRYGLGPGGREDLSGNPAGLVCSLSLSHCGGSPSPCCRGSSQQSSASTTCLRYGRGMASSYQEPLCLCFLWRCAAPRGHGARQKRTGHQAGVHAASGPPVSTTVRVLCCVVLGLKCAACISRSCQMLYGVACSRLAYKVSSFSYRKHLHRKALDALSAVRVNCSRSVPQRLNCRYSR